MAKHMELGGCGMRPVLDLVLLDRMPDGDHAAREKLLAEGSLTAFAREAKKLAAVWFLPDAPERDAFTDRFETYIASGGSFGNLGTLTAAESGRKGKAAYTAQMFFPPFDRMKKQYPVLEKHKALLPVCYVRRFAKILREGRAGEDMMKLAGAAKAGKDKTAAMSEMFEKLGL